MARRRSLGGSMKAIDVINKNRQAFEKLNQYHLDWQKSNGEVGVACSDYQEFLENYYNLTDEQILQRVLERGIIIEDIEEYLANKKEKTN